MAGEVSRNMAALLQVVDLRVPNRQRAFLLRPEEVEVLEGVLRPSDQDHAFVAVVFKRIPAHHEV